jgi:hypothetical protein
MNIYLENGHHLIERINMKKLLGILVMVLWCNLGVADSEGYVVLDRGDSNKMIWNLKTIKEIGYMQYGIDFTTRPTRERVLYIKNNIKELVNYCDLPAGKHDSTNKLFELGPPELKDSGVLVEEFNVEDGDGKQKIIKYWIPYKRFLPTREKEKGSKYAQFSIRCQQYYENSKTLMSKKALTDFHIKIMTSDLKEEEFYDCDRIMYTNRKINYYDLNPTDELYPWKAFSPGANGEFYIKTVCAKLGH